MTSPLLPVSLGGRKMGGGEKGRKRYNGRQRGKKKKSELGRIDNREKFEGFVAILRQL